MTDSDLPEDLRPSSKKASNNYSRVFLIIAAFVVVAGLSFWGGSSYEKDHDRVGVATVTNSFARGGRGIYPGGQRGGYGGFGLVTAISSTSISVQNPQVGTTKTYSIISSTVITDSGATVTYSDIQDGDMVAITASSSSATTAATIVVNPSYGGPGGGSPSSSGT